MENQKEIIEKIEWTRFTDCKPPVGEIVFVLTNKYVANFGKVNIFQTKIKNGHFRISFSKCKGWCTREEYVNALNN